MKNVEIIGEKNVKIIYEIINNMFGNLYRVSILTSIDKAIKLVETYLN